MANRPARSPAGLRTRRAAVLAGLGTLSVVVLAPQLTLYVQQQREIAALEGEIGVQEADVARLDGEIALWQDDAYVAAQARERLNYVFPGETGYVVPDLPVGSGTGTDPATGGETGSDVVRPAAAVEGTWYDRVWSSVEAVGVGATDPVLDAPVVGDEGDG